MAKQQKRFTIAPPPILIKHSKKLKYLGLFILLVALSISFWYNAAWLMLCYGLALFLFGMQSIEGALHNAAGGSLERIMARSTETPLKGLMFGIGSTFILQSGTLVSLLTIAFLSTGMITLAGGIAVILGTNLGATGGIWLLAWAGKSVSLSPVAIPMLVIGVLIGFINKNLKAFGQALIGIALIFLGIDAIKEGFSAFGDIQFDGSHVSSIGQVLLFSMMGFLLTLVLQSSHATLILALAALAGGQITLTQGFAIALGSNLGSSATTALVGMLSSDRNGQRLAIAHIIFNAITTLVSLIFWLPLTLGVTWISKLVGMTSPLLQLALFHTLFNVLGVGTFWKFQDKLARKLQKVLPNKKPESQLPDGSKAVKALHLHSNMLKAADTAIHAINKEVQHLATVGTEVICHAIYVPNDELYHPSDNLPKPLKPLQMDVQSLYEWQIKPLYSEILNFSSRLDVSEDVEQQKKLTDAHIAAFHIVEIVKESKHLQKNMQHFLSEPELEIHQDYMKMRKHVFKMLINFNHVRSFKKDSEERQLATKEFVHYSKDLTQLNNKVLQKIRNNNLDGLQASSLINDMNYVRRIGVGLTDILTNLDGTIPSHNP